MFGCALAAVDGVIVQGPRHLEALANLIPPRVYPLVGADRGNRAMCRSIASRPAKDLQMRLPQLSTQECVPDGTIVQTAFDCSLCPRQRDGKSDFPNYPPMEATQSGIALERRSTKRKTQPRAIISYHGPPS